MGEGPLIPGIDETLERRHGKKISARRVYQDPVRSTHETFVKSSGLRWVCVMLFSEIPWASRVWALPFLSALAPSERYAAKRGRRHNQRGRPRIKGARLPNLSVAPGRTDYRRACFSALMH